MELINVTQMNTKGRIPVFGIESKIKTKKQFRQTLAKVSGYKMKGWLPAEAEVNQ